MGIWVRKEKYSSPKIPSVCSFNKNLNPRITPKSSSVTISAQLCLCLELLVWNESLNEGLQWNLGCAAWWFIDLCFHFIVVLKSQTEQPLSCFIQASGHTWSVMHELFERMASSMLSSKFCHVKTRIFKGEMYYYLLFSLSLIFSLILVNGLSFLMIVEVFQCDLQDKVVNVWQVVSNKNEPVDAELWTNHFHLQTFTLWVVTFM